MNSCLKAHGGKSYLVNELIKLQPKSGVLHRVEPYCFSAAWTLANDPEGVSEVVNDMNGDISNFWTVLQGAESFAQFKRICDVTPFSFGEWQRSEIEFLEWPELDENVSDRVTRAHRFFVFCRQSMAGRMKSFAPLSRNRVRRGMNEQASAWWSAIEGLPEIHERLKRVVILNDDAVKVIKQQDGEKTLFFLDPTYLPETRTAKKVYKHEMTVDQHADLLSVLCELKGRFLLSGYANELYDHVAKSAGWRRVDFDLPNHAASGESKRRMTECVWMNYDPE